MGLQSTGAQAEKSRMILGRFNEKVEKLPDAPGCWLWIGAIAGTGYGSFHVAGRNRPAHRVSYEIHRGRIPAGLTLDHLCRVPSCVNPAHLQPVTMAENLRRGFGQSVRNTAHTHCPKGHQLDGITTRASGRKQRYCRRAIATAPGPAGVKARICRDKKERPARVASRRARK